jgi:hypothetical protein
MCREDDLSTGMITHAELRAPSICNTEQFVGRVSAIDAGIFVGPKHSADIREY